MSVTPSPFGPKPQFVDATGSPDLSYKLFFYAAGSNTKQDTFTDSTGTSANANPLLLNSLGQPTSELWFTVGQLYKVVLAPATDTDPPTSPIWTIDNIQGMGTVTTTAVQDQWILYPAAPTFISATSFSLVGNQTATFQVNRRVKTVNAAGAIVYSTITASVFGAVTTVTVVNDSGTLDAGLSAVSYGILSPQNPSAPAIRSSIRLSVTNGYGSTNNKIRRFTNTLLSQGTDITYADSATLGASFTINVTGVYAISYGDQFTGASNNGISLNTTQPTTAIASITDADRLCINTTPSVDSIAIASGSFYLPAGSVIRPHTQGAVSGASTAVTFFVITRSS